MENSPNTDPLVQQNKKLKLFLIISVLLSVISISAIIIIFVFQLYPSEVPYMDTLPPFVVPETSKEANLDNGNTDITDVSEYTDIVLSDYDGLEVYVSEGFDDVPSIVSGMVEYTLKSYRYSDENEDVKYELYGPNMRMEIVNEKILANEDQEALFEQAKLDIINKNIDADYFEVGYLDIFRNSLSDAAYKPVKTIEVDYPNTDSVFGVLFLGGYQDGPFAYPSKEENIGAPVTLRVYAIKGDNLISLSSFYFHTSELGVSKEVHNSCTIEDSDEYTPNYEGYFDVDCLSEVLQSDEYDEKIQEFTDDLVERFELAE
ncbi:MAG: hypothetical protein XD93_0396 [candidate division WS6 bacterium 34_10]|uniref:Uncharacterized protein n=1 Tax=candidate division WS6 bacterium 34_10 TaxID=1641389 RepID=A0A117M0A3_9BACT|nr:MAG: hypothetical protein XD93_0396 [candidate division WS6 bacterium 34_10]